MQNVKYRVEVKPAVQSLESRNSEVICFLLCAVYLLLKSISAAVLADLHLIFVD